MTALLFGRRQSPAAGQGQTKEHFLNQQEVVMFKPTLQKLVKDQFYAQHIPAFIRIPALGAITEETTKPVSEATLDDLAFAAQALDQESSVIRRREMAIKELYNEARKHGALGSENIIDALSRKAGAQ